MSQVQGFKYDPEGEYVRQWLPELARMPAEWIHHPWDAPLAVLKASGVELGLNYPKPIIDLDLARDRLTEAIFIMRGKEATARATNSNGTDEVVFDNSETSKIVGNPKAGLREKLPCPTSSSHDQMVPSMQNFKNVTLNRKRPMPAEDKQPLRDNVHNCNAKVEASKMDDDLCSTAESSTKKQTTSSSTSFSVPQAGSLVSKVKSFPEGEPSDLKLQVEEETDIEETSRENS